MAETARTLVFSHTSSETLVLMVVLAPRRAAMSSCSPLLWDMSVAMLPVQVSLTPRSAFFWT
jgi:hypothetical protein